jgi:hypothetical protein
MLERQFRTRLLARLTHEFPGCTIITNDPSRSQGIPDLLVLYGTQWAMLELKRSLNAPVRPNQEYYVEHFDAISFARFICPETEEEVISALQRAFGVGR